MTDPDPVRPFDHGAELGDRARADAALYAVGAMPAAEADAYELHLDECVACEGEVSSLRQVASELALAAPPLEPSQRLFDRLRARIAAPVEPEHDMEREPAGPARDEVRPWRAWSASPEQPVIVTAAESGFEPTGMPGVAVRRLHVDVARDRATMLVRMAPGSSYPGHRHGGPEECLVLEGELRVGAEHMSAGDYQYEPPGSVHPVQSTESGCLLLIVSSLRDELLP
jgi:anti-sigma factor ChrR (cupin superfamily)